MGYATILGGGTDGRYIVELDWGLSTKSAILASLSALRSQLDIRIGQAQAKVEAVNARAATLAARIETEILSIIERQNTLPPGSPGLQDNDAILRQLYEQRRALELERQPLLSNVNALTFQRQQADRDIAYWNNVSGNETRQAWCTDLTEGAAVGTLVATMDIPGDSSLIVLAPGCRGWQPSDGQFRARELCSPEQAFFNAAIAPGWAKFLPTYRWGTIMGLNYEADTATVSLATATMTGQALNVNQSSTLTNIPVVYMTCNSRAFRLGDRVVVQFVGQDWAAARVVGFVDNPRSCRKLAVSISVPAVSGWPSMTPISEDVYDLSEVPPATAPSPGAAQIFVGWDIKFHGGAPSQLSYQKAAFLAGFEWRYVDLPFTNYTATGYYARVGPVTWTERSITFDDPPNGIDPVMWRFRVVVRPLGTLVNFVGELSEMAISSPFDSTPANAVVTTLYHTYTGVEGDSVPFDYTATWSADPDDGERWIVTSIVDNLA